jgi:hypothetical protein
MDDEVGGTCSIHGENEKYIVLFEIPEGKR